MKEFIALRAKAREKRDRAIALARTDYEDTLRRIAAIEQDLLGRDPSTHKKLSTAIESVIPYDRTFTTVDVMTSLESLDTSRVWRKRSVDSHISRLREKGLVKRMKKAKTTEPAIYVRTGVEVDPLPFQDMRLPEVIAAVLGDRALTQTEIVVAMLEQGYDSTMKPKALRDAVGTAMRKDLSRFRNNNGKWST